MTRMHCRKDQIKDEFKRVMKLTIGAFQDFWFERFLVQVACWSPEHLENISMSQTYWIGRRRNS